MGVDYEDWPERPEMPANGCMHAGISNPLIVVHAVFPERVVFDDGHLDFFYERLVESMRILLISHEG